MAGRATTDYEKFGTPFTVTFAGASLAGTQSSLAAIAATTVCLPFKSKLRGATRCSTTGGTAAGPTALVQYSLAGTGSWTSIGTAAFGTDANGASSDFSVTETELADGDLVRVAIAAGTAAATHTANFMLEFVDVR